MTPSPVEVSVVVPVKNEAENIRPLIAEIAAALDNVAAHEIVYVDDGSDDETPAQLVAASGRYPQLRVLRHQRSCGQSAAVRTGVLAARAQVVATLDGDGQNDPADIPSLLGAYREAGGQTDALPAQGAVAMIAGRRAKRRDTWVRRASSRVANGARNWMLGDDTPDSGCGLKVFSRAVFLRLPYFDHMHRFLPALVRREGYRIESHDVNHRPRTRGRSKYGVFNRLWVGIVDLFGVMWLNRRIRRPVVIDDPGNGQKASP